MTIDIEEFLASQVENVVLIKAPNILSICTDPSRQTDLSLQTQVLFEFG